MVDYKPRRTTKLPDRYRLPKPTSRTSKRRLEEILKSYPNTEVEQEQERSKTPKNDSGRGKKKEVSRLSQTLEITDK